MLGSINTTLKGYLFGVVSAVCYGLNPLFALPMYSEGMSVDSVLFWRYLLSIILLGVLVKVQKEDFKISKSELVPLMILGVLFALSSLFLFLSYNYMDAGIASTILFVYPVAVVLINMIFFKERLKLLAYVAIAMAMGGVVLLCKTDGGEFLSFIGITFVIISALSFAIYIIGIKSEKLRALPTVKLTFYVTLFGISIFIVRLLLSGDFQVPASTLTWGTALGAALFPTIISLVALAKAVQYIGGTKSAVLGALEPVTALLIGIMVFEESLTNRLIVGIVLIIMSVTMIVTGGKIPFVKSKKN